MRPAWTYTMPHNDRAARMDRMLLWFEAQLPRHNVSEWSIRATPTLRPRHLEEVPGVCWAGWACWGDVPHVPDTDGSCAVRVSY